MKHLKAYRIFESSEISISDQNLIKEIFLDVFDKFNFEYFNYDAIHIDQVSRPSLVDQDGYRLDIYSPYLNYKYFPIGNNNANKLTMLNLELLNQSFIEFNIFLPYGIDMNDIIELLLDFKKRIEELGFKLKFTNNYNSYFYTFIQFVISF